MKTSTAYELNKLCNFVHFDVLSQVVQRSLDLILSSLLACSLAIEARILVIRYHNVNNCGHCRITVRVSGSSPPSLRSACKDSNCYALSLLKYPHVRTRELPVLRISGLFQQILTTPFIASSPHFTTILAAFPFRQECVHLFSILLLDRCFQYATRLQAFGLFSCTS